ncbi:MAG: PIG-L deacetylase family protein [Anaerolineae bacterium]
MKILFLSPHYDDAIYSCGGTIYELSQQGHTVEIITVMAGEPTPPLPDTPVVRDNHQRWQAGGNPIMARRKEDYIATAIVGAQARHLDVLDCIYRTDAEGNALYPNEASLWEVVHPCDDIGSVLNELDLHSTDQLYAPMGVGAHVDHLIVRNWAWQFAQNTSIPVQFYLEYPYLRKHEAINTAYRFFAGGVLTVDRPFSEIAMQHKVQAMTAYRSQIKSFWDDTSAIDAEVRRTFAHGKGFAEVFAHLTQA